jgi:agmatine deiminase
MKYLITFIIGLVLCSASPLSAQYVMPEESTLHEGTWLQWPHHYTYGYFYRNSLDATWVAMTTALVDGEKVHIVAYNNAEKERIIDLLNDAGVALDNVDFYIHPTDDVWVRDNGPMFVYDADNNLIVLDWGFNGWGNDTPYEKCDAIPSLLSLELPVIDLSAMVLEGGAVEHDGNGTLMATRSSVTHPSRNPNLTESEIEDYLSNYMGISKFIWLDGVYGSELTDMHIDGFMKFVNDSTILTFNEPDLQYWEVSQKDIDTLMNARNAEGEPYNFFTVPLTQNDVTTAYGYDLGYKGSYCNYYIANNVVLVPNYNDPNDAVANAIIQDLHPDRTVVGVDVRNLYEYGGMVHCVTQQQPVDLSTVSINIPDEHKDISVEISPNPATDVLHVRVYLEYSDQVLLSVYDMQGKAVLFVQMDDSSRIHEVEMPIMNLKKGVYNLIIKTDNDLIYSRKMVVH